MVTRLDALTVTVDALLDRCEALEARLGELPRWRLLARLRAHRELMATAASLARFERRRIAVRRESENPQRQSEDTDPLGLDPLGPMA